MKAHLRTRCLRWGAALALCSCFAALAGVEEPTIAVRAAEFLSSLGPALRARAALPFSDPARTSWMFTPGIRPGVSLKDLDESQRAKALALLRSSLSAAGWEKAEGIRKLEAVLRESEGAGRDPEYYVLVIFGEPGDRGRWSWRYEGHHISLHFAFANGSLVATTPQFFGANPAEVPSGPHKGLRVLAKEEDLARQLVASLSPELRARAVIADRAPTDIVSSNLRVATRLSEDGVAYRDLHAAQQAMLKRLVEAHAEAQLPKAAKARLDRIDKTGWEDVRFAWLGSTTKGQGHYYRIQGATFLIEYDNTQNRANHIHTVWREFKGDFGEDLLADHYRSHPHPHR